MQYVALIYQGTTPLPGTPAWDALPEEEQKAVYADYAALNQTSGVTPGLPGCGWRSRWPRRDHPPPARNSPRSLPSSPQTGRP